MDEIKDKIIIAVKSAIANNAEAVDCDYGIIEIDCEDVDHIAEQVADALIAANIGDVTEYKHCAEVAERALTTVCEEVLRARYPVESVTVSVVDDFIQYTLKEAEKELTEGKGE